jgi:two-component system CheB/CheR fusion protein
LELRCAARNPELGFENEEICSSNEKLETAKEEVQTANEELRTAYDELQQRKDVLTQTSKDLTNLLNRVNILVLMLTNVRVPQFAPATQKVLSVRPSDVRRAVGEIRLQLGIENIEPMLNDVLETLNTKELEV